MIKLYGFGGFPDLANGTIDASPCVLKVDAYLKLTGIEHEIHGSIADLPNSPKGKMPFIDDGGEIIADSSFIIRYLKSQKQHDLDSALSDDQLAISHAFIKMMDENLYWCIAVARYTTKNPTGNALFPLLLDAFRNDFPILIRPFGAFLFRLKLKTQLYFQGFGKHTYEEVVSIASWDAKSLSDLLGDKPYFFGDRPSTLDAAAFGFLAQFILMKTKDDILLAVSEHKNLVDFCHRIYNAHYT